MSYGDNNLTPTARGAPANYGYSMGSAGRNRSPVAGEQPTSLASTRASLPEPKVLAEWNSHSVAQLRGEFLHSCLPLFFASEHPLRSLGLTSAVEGEGKTSAAWLMSYALATSSRRRIVLVECDWERPTFARDLDLPTSHGLADYLSGACNLAAISYQFWPNLTVIPAGNGTIDAISSLANMQRPELYHRLTDPGDIMILDLPPVLSSSYGLISARLVEALMLVVRAGETPTPLVVRACEELKPLMIEGIILNQMQTSIPDWMQRLL